MICPHERIRGPVGDPEPDGVAQRDRLVVVCADIANGRDPRGQQRPAGLSENEVAEFPAPRQLTVLWIGRPEAGTA